ncbi:MAG: glycosyltransferase family 4 protein [Verrucomicrobia bacterium]|nr:glycosyltransferase family 4 protein [Verrucomicrobiota bacterium]
MLRILFINDYASVRGGADQVAITEAASLAAVGHCVRFVCSMPGVIDDRLLVAGVEVCSPPTQGGGGLRVSPLQGLWNKSIAKWLRGILEDQSRKPDIVHVHGWTKGFSPSFFTVLRQAKIPYVVTLHDYVMACPNGAFYDFGGSMICHRRPLGISCLTCNCDRIGRKEKLWRVTRQYLAKYTAQIPSCLPHVINVSRFSQRILSEFVSPVTEMCVLGNPIGVEKRPRLPAPKEGSFCFVGRFTKEKGVEALARASAIANVKVRYVGAGESEQLIRNLSPSAEIVGWKSPSEVHDIMRQSTAVVFPSSWYECQPLVPLEAAALGVQSIVSDICAAVESVRDGETGFHFVDGSIESLAAKLTAAIQPGIADIHGAAAYANYWSQPSDPESHAVKLLQVYRNMLCVKPAGVS